MQLRLDHSFVVQFISYGLAGATAVAAHLLVLWCLVELAGTESTLASAIGFCCAVPINYLLQHRLVFSQRSNHVRFFVRYVVVTFAALGLNVALFSTAVYVLGIHYMVAQVIATSIVFFVNFSVNRAYTFAGIPGEDDPSARSEKTTSVKPEDMTVPADAAKEAAVEPELARLRFESPGEASPAQATERSASTSQVQHIP
ncbi:MAG: GtrA family protein [Alphaproteobacteria bacterium]|nr:GtrA family protein [Alphaproteobacteria bacterium]